jgi:transcriptional regulator with XRE-family HTH domain
MTLGINHETLRRMNTGQLPSAELLVRLCEEYGISGDWLLTGQPRRSPELFARRESELVVKVGWNKPS